MRYLALLIAFTACLTLSPAMAEVEPFHPAHTDAEEALDNILQHGDTDQSLVWFLFNYPGRDKTHDAKHLEIVTHGFAKSVAQLEMKLVQKDCGGKYRDGELCGFDASPLTCAQDTIGNHLYRTGTQTPTTANIAAIWEEQDPQYGYNKYRMVKVGKRWKLDGVLCVGDDNFNYDATSK